MGPRAWRRFARIAAGAVAPFAVLAPALSSAPAGAQENELLLPDLQVLEPEELRIGEGPNGERQLRFSTTVVNVGEGAFRVVGTDDAASGRTRVVQYFDGVGAEGQTHLVGSFELHPGHGHWHVEDFSRMELFAHGDDGTLRRRTARSEKISSCIRDRSPLEGAPDASGTPEFDDCGTRTQGISVGWTDTYGSNFNGQKVDISGVADGRYLLRLTIDPERTFREVTTVNNVVDVYVELRGTELRRCDPPPGACTTSADGGASPSFRVLAGGLESPWDLTFTPDRRAFLTERDRGVVSELTSGRIREVHRFDVDSAGEGGLLGLAVSPSFSDDGSLFAYLTTAADNRVVRFVPGGEEEAILTGIPSATIHNGGRIAFGPDGMLYVGTGDAGSSSRAQHASSLAGKILRVAPDGSVPADNPTPGSLVYAMGFRNVQGLAWLPDGRMIASEFGPDVDDEINVVEAGANYGWPERTGRGGKDSGFTDPVVVKQPDEASWSGLAVVPLDADSLWGGDVLVASLRGERLWRLTFAPDGILQDEEAIAVDRFGRLRAAVRAPDDSIWVLTSNRDGRGSPAPEDDRVIRVELP